MRWGEVPVIRVHPQPATGADLDRKHGLHLHLHRHYRPDDCQHYHEHYHSDEQLVDGSMDSRLVAGSRKSQSVDEAARSGLGVILKHTCGGEQKTRHYEPMHEPMRHATRILHRRRK